MALHLPKPRTRKPAQQAVRLDGLKVSVANAATSGVEKSKQVTTSPRPSQRNTIGLCLRWNDT